MNLLLEAFGLRRSGLFPPCFPSVRFVFEIPRYFRLLLDPVVQNAGPAVNPQHRPEESIDLKLRHADNSEAGLLERACCMR